MPTKDITKDQFAFSVIKSPVSTSMEPREAKAGGTANYYEWGKMNNYPAYLYELYLRSSTLKSIIDGIRDYVVGKDVVLNPLITDIWSGEINDKGESIRDVFRQAVFNFVLTGNLAIHVINNYFYRPVSIEAVPMTHIRTNFDNRIITYNSTGWAAGSSARDLIELPAFSRNLKAAESIFFFKDACAAGVYGVPMHVGALDDVETQIAIKHFHKNNAVNGFMSSIYVNFNNGIPTDEVREEIERKFKMKFSGVNSSGEAVMSWNNDQDHSMEIGRIPQDDLDTKFQAQSKDTRQNIFIAFRAIPALFGLMTESTGFSEQEFKEAFALFDTTIITPIRDTIIQAFDKIFGVEDSIKIKPFNFGTTEITKDDEGNVEVTTEQTTQNNE